MQLRDIEGKSYKEIAAVLDITEQLYDLDHVYDPDSDKWIARYGGNANVTVTAFMLYCYDSGYLLEQDDEVLYLYKNGELKKIMDVPEKAEFDYCIWKR